MQPAQAGQKGTSCDGQGRRGGGKERAAGARSSRRGTPPTATAVATVVVVCPASAGRKSGRGGGGPPRRTTSPCGREHTGGGGGGGGGHSRSTGGPRCTPPARAHARGAESRSRRQGLFLARQPVAAGRPPPPRRRDRRRDTVTLLAPRQPGHRHHPRPPPLPPKAVWSPSQRRITAPQAAHVNPPSCLPPSRPPPPATLAPTVGPPAPLPVPGRQRCGRGTPPRAARPCRGAGGQHHGQSRAGGRRQACASGSGKGRGGSTRSRWPLSLFHRPSHRWPRLVSVDGPRTRHAGRACTACATPLGADTIVRDRDPPRCRTSCRRPSCRRRVPCACHHRRRTKGVRILYAPPPPQPSPHDHSTKAHPEPPVPSPCSAKRPTPSRCLPLQEA